MRRVAPRNLLAGCPTQAKLVWELIGTTRRLCPWRVAHTISLAGGRHNRLTGINTFAAITLCSASYLKRELWTNSGTGSAYMQDQGFVITPSIE